MPNTTSTTDPLYPPSLAANHLANRMGQTQILWAQRLANWRRPQRLARAPIKPTTTDAGQPVYPLSTLEQFIVEQQAQNAKNAEHGPQPRAVAIPEIYETGEPHIRVLFSAGKFSRSVFTLDVAAARTLADSLVKAAKIVELGAPTEEAAAAEQRRFVDTLTFGTFDWLGLD